MFKYRNGTEPATTKVWDVTSCEMVITDDLKVSGLEWILPDPSVCQQRILMRVGGGGGCVLVADDINTVSTHQYFFLYDALNSKKKTKRPLRLKG